MNFIKVTSAHRLKVRFWTHFGFSGTHEMAPWIAIFGQKTEKGELHRVTASVLGPTRATCNVARPKPNLSSDLSIPKRLA